MYISCWFTKGWKYCERQTKGKTQDCYHFHHLETLIQSLTSSAFLMRGSQREVSCAPTVRAVPKAASALTVRFFWLIACLVAVKTVSYIIFITPTRSSFGSQLTWFVSTVPLFTMVHPAYEIFNWRVCQRSMFNTITSLWQPVLSERKPWTRTNCARGESYEPPQAIPAQDTLQK